MTDLNRSKTAIGLNLYLNLLLAIPGGTYVHTCTTSSSRIHIIHIYIYIDIHIYLNLYIRYIIYII